MKHKFISFNRDYSNKIHEELKKWLKDIFKFSNNDINKFVLLSRRGVYCHEYMDHWKILKKQHYLKKKNFTLF